MCSNLETRCRSKKTTEEPTIITRQTEARALKAANSTCSTEGSIRIISNLSTKTKVPIPQISISLFLILNLSKEALMAAIPKATANLTEREPRELKDPTAAPSPGKEATLSSTTSLQAWAPSSPSSPKATAQPILGKTSREVEAEELPPNSRTTTSNNWEVRLLTEGALTLCREATSTNSILWA